VNRTPLVVRAIVLAVCLSSLGLSIVVAQQAGGGSTQPVQLANEGTAALSGVVTDADTRQPIAGVMVYLGFQGRGAVGRLSRQLSDDKGRFVFTDLAAGSLYFINASKSGYLEGHYGVGAGGLLGGLIALTDGQWFSEANVVMQRPGSIAGTITDEHGEPAVGVLVRTLCRVSLGGRMRLAVGQTAKTDDRGVYRLADLMPGRYMVQVPFVQQTFSSTLSAAELAGIPAEQAAAGRTAPDPPPAVDLPGGTRLVVGAFLPPPAPVNGRPQAYSPSFHPGVSTISAASLVDVKAGEDKYGIDVALHPVPATSIAGVLEGPAEAVTGSIMRLLPDGLEELGISGEIATATVGADGRFAFVNVPAGPYTIDVRRTSTELSYRTPLATAPVPMPVTPGTTSSGSGGIMAGPYGANYSIRSARGTTAYFAQQRVTVGDGPVADLAVSLRQGVTIRGKFVSETGAPLTPAPGPDAPTVYAEPADGNPGLGILPSTSRVPMTLEINGLLGGQYVLRFLSMPFAGSIKSAVADDGIDHRFKPFDASLGRDFEVVVTVTEKKIDLSGTATDPKGGQVKNAIVFAFPVEREQWTNYGLSPARLKGSPTTNAGTYRFQSLPAGDYYVIGVPSDQGEVWQDPAKLAMLAPQAARVSVAWGDTKVQNVTVVRVQ
jgi:hypothetical protein